MRIRTVQISPDPSEGLCPASGLDRRIRTVLCRETAYEDPDSPDQSGSFRKYMMIKESCLGSQGYTGPL